MASVYAHRACAIAFPCVKMDGSGSASCDCGAVMAAAVHAPRLRTQWVPPMRGDRGGRGAVVIMAVQAAALVGTPLLSLLVLIEAHAGDGVGGNAGAGSRRFAATRARGAGAGAGAIAGAGAALRFVVVSHLDVASCIALALVVVLELEAALAILLALAGGGGCVCGLVDNGGHAGETPYPGSWCSIGPLSVVRRRVCVASLLLLAPELDDAPVAAPLVVLEPSVLSVRFTASVWKFITRSMAQMMAMALAMTMAMAVATAIVGRGRGRGRRIFVVASVCTVSIPPSERWLSISKNECERQLTVDIARLPGAFPANHKPTPRQPPSKAETATKLEDIEDEHPLGCFCDVADGRMGVDGDERPTTWLLMKR
ncbi:hypothetical protein BD410DRAFT_803012 [Rickenella mellea]|uniref:Uncharacterized protein n=1 Tax=Rickenella mellea TaxID=50990 RepID=A0A4Y7Q6K7_9AGAM|nr:hypothetical protein BD410DRAFT_803012 [Rickenella mellea]